MQPRLKLLMQQHATPSQPAIEALSPEALEETNSELSYQVASLEADQMLADVDALTRAVATVESLSATIDHLALHPQPGNVKAVESLTGLMHQQLLAVGVPTEVGLERIDIDGAGIIQRAGHATIDLIKRLIALIGKMIAKIAAFIKSIFVGLTADLNKAHAAVGDAKRAIKAAKPGSSYAVPLSARTEEVLGPNARNLGKYLNEGLAAAADFKVLHALVNEALQHTFQLTEGNHKSYLDGLTHRTLSLNFTGFATTTQAGETHVKAKAQVPGVRQVELVFKPVQEQSGDGKNWPALQAFRELVNGASLVVYKGPNQQPAAGAQPKTLSAADLSTTLGSMENFLKECSAWAREYKSVYDSIEAANRQLNRKCESEAKRIEASLGSADEVAAAEAERANNENYQRLIFIQSLNQLCAKYNAFFKVHGSSMVAITNACRFFAKTTSHVIKQSNKMAKLEDKQAAKGF